MVRNRQWMVGAMAVLMLAGCGVPREAGRLAADEAALFADVPAEDGEVRARLVAQEAAWAKLSLLLQERELGGIAGVDPSFVELVKQTAVLARRQRELIERGQDDAAFDRQALERFEGLWKSAEKYLGK